MKKTIRKVQSDYPKCPWCHQEINAFSGDAEPKDGDISFCFECTEPCFIVVDDGVLTLRLPLNDEEKETLDSVKLAMFASMRD